MGFKEIARWRKNLKKIYALISNIQAKPYALEFKGSTNVLLDNQWVPLNIAIETSKMEAFLDQYL